MSADIVISINNIDKVYKLYAEPSYRLKEALHPFRRKYHYKFHALKNISFQVKRGETIGIIGKNGSGKSTLLKILSRVLTPSQGDVHVDGKVSALLELGAGFNPEMTGVENVFFHGMLLGFTHLEMKQKMDEILAFADIGDFVYQPVKSYSSGMFVRLAFAVSVSVEPDILIVDEALAVGDMSFQKKCLERIDAFKKKGKTILYCGHDMHTMHSLCDRVMWLRDGEIAAIGESSEVISEYVAWMTRPSVSGREGVATKEIEVSPNHYVRNSEIVEIKSVQCLNSEGAPVDSFMEGDDVYFTAEYEAKVAIEEPNYSYIVFDHKKNPVAIGKRSFDCRVKDLAEGKVRVKFCLDKIPLNQGRFTMGFSVWDKFNKIAYANNITCDFEIRTLKVTFGPTEEKCVFFPKTRWLD